MKPWKFKLKSSPITNRSAKVSRNATVRIDRRIQKTKRGLSQALVELILERGYEQITVQDILDRANVGRSTFYAHYRDKEALLLACFDDMQTQLRSAIDADAPTDALAGTAAAPVTGPCGRRRGGTAPRPRAGRAGHDDPPGRRHRPDAPLQ